MRFKPAFTILLCVFLAGFANGYAQTTKKPLDHSVYDKWYSIGGYALTTDGKYAAVQNSRNRNDGFLQIINTIDGSDVKIERGANPQFTLDNKHLVCFIKPFWKAQEEAKIKKFKGDKVPKDSLCIYNLTTGKQVKYPMAVKYAQPEEGGNYVAFKARVENDTLKKDAVFIYNLVKGAVTDTLKNVDSFMFNKKGTQLYAIFKADKKDKKGNNGVFIYNPATKERKVIAEGAKKSDFASLTLSENEQVLLFYANTDTTKKFDENVEIFSYKEGAERAERIISNSIKGLPDGYRISNNSSLNISNDNSRLFFGIGKIMPQKDTSKFQPKKASLDIWHYQDPYLQTQQTLNVKRELKRTYLSYAKLNENAQLESAFKDGAQMIQLAKVGYPSVMVPNDWNANWAYAVSSEKYTIQRQWSANGVSDILLISLEDGSAEMLMEGAMLKSISASPEGKFITWYDPVKKHWFSWSKATGETKNITENITVPLWNEMHDTPQLPSAYGTGGWRKGDKSLFINDKYDVWEVDPSGVKAPQMVTEGKGRELGYTFRLTKLEEPKSPAPNMMRRMFKEEPVKDSDNLYFTAFDNKSKGYGYYTRTYKGKKLQPLKKLIMEPEYNLASLSKAKNSNVITYVKSNFVESPNVWVTRDMFKTSNKLTNTNPQQKEYNWGTVELVYWKTHDGKDAEGLLYKPENFDSTKKYPMVCYFYETRSNTKNNYIRPNVSRSTVNITYFASNGYLVFVPDIHYTDGHPGKCAINYIVSGAESLAKKSWVDEDNIAIQGQSWGGYQVAYLITQTDMFKCAGSGAPVSNMTSAYGGIRWASGMVRQFQYEHTQSRIGKTLWDEGGLDLYIENSPLFFVDKVNTPVLIMHNDKDGAVPWTQGIEFFTALKRFGKQAWMLQYNNEEHNLVQYENCYDYTIRLSQFMDHFLKGAPMPVWMKHGVPATLKGIDWGLELVEEE